LSLRLINKQAKHNQQETGAVLKWSVSSNKTLFTRLLHRIKTNHVSYSQNLLLSCSRIVHPQCTFLIRNSFSSAFSSSFPCPNSTTTFIPRFVSISHTLLHSLISPFNFYIFISRSWRNCRKPWFNFFCEANVFKSIISTRQRHRKGFNFTLMFTIVQIFVINKLINPNVCIPHLLILIKEYN
jgi:hypothetical protein